MSDHVQLTIEALRALGWTVQAAHAGTASLPEWAIQRMPNGHMRLLNGILSAEGPGGDAWLVSASDFLGTTNAAFRWNEFELMSIEGADGDGPWVSEIRDFWSRVLPVAMMVGGEYRYLGWRRLSDGEFELVEGCAPEFESPRVLGRGDEALLIAVRGGALGRGR